MLAIAKKPPTTNDTLSKPERATARTETTGQSEGPSPIDRRDESEAP